MKSRRKKKTTAAKRQANARRGRSKPGSNARRSNKRLALARKAFASLAPEEQMQLAREAAETRLGELQQAFPELLNAFAGYRTQRIASGKLRVRSKICVVFVVPRKKPVAGRKRQRFLPEELLAYHHGSDGLSVLCAIPTDVDEARAYEKLRIQAPPQLEVVPSGQPHGEEASFACVIRRSTFPDDAFLVGCRHGFSLTELFHPQRPACDVRAGGQVVAKTLRLAGDLAADPAESFDAQLAKVNGAAALNGLVTSLRLNGHAVNQAALSDVDAFVQSPKLGAVPVKFRAVVPNVVINYRAPGLAQVRHAELIQFAFAGSLKTKAGDSGSAVTSKRDGGMLLGMHIAALVDPNDPANERTFAIPAWRLLDPGKYVGVAASERWTLLDSAPAPAAGGMTVAAASVAALAPAAAIVAAGIPASLAVDHRFFDSVIWRLESDGIHIGGQTPELDSKNIPALNTFLGSFQGPCEAAARQFSVPIELIIATAMTESSGDPNAIRMEPGFQSDDATPHRVSVGLMQTLISTAREKMRDPTITRASLLVPANSIMAGTATIASRVKSTEFDPPKVACAYNAGSLIHNDSPNNRWRMRQFPIGTSKHADRFVKWFNACTLVLRQRGLTPGVPSFM